MCRVRGQIATHIHHFTLHLIFADAAAWRARAVLWRVVAVAKHRADCN